MITERLPYFFEPAHAAVERRAAGFVGEGPVRQRVAALGEAGLLDGLATGDTRTIALIRGKLAYRDPLDDLAFIIQELGAVPLARAGGFAAELAEARAGRLVLAFALTEPDAGSDVRALTTRATRTGGEWRLNGTKWFISNAPDCDAAVVFARTDDGVGAFFVSAPVATEQFVAGHSIGRFDFVDTPVRLVSERGLALALTTLERCRPTVGLAAWGMARRAFDEARRYVGEREQFGAPLAALAVVQAQIADMALELDTCLFPALHACWKRDTSPASTRTGYEAAVGKVVATEAACRIIDVAVQLHGARGVEASSIVQQLYRGVRPLRIYEGATDVLKTLIATRWLDRGPS